MSTIDAPPLARRDTSVSLLRGYDRCHAPGHTDAQADVVVKDAALCRGHAVERLVEILKGLPHAHRYHPFPQSFHEDVP